MALGQARAGPALWVLWLSALNPSMLLLGSESPPGASS